MNGNPITSESIVYGGAMGIMIVPVIIWCKCFSRIITTDASSYMFSGCINPKADFNFIDVTQIYTVI